MAAAGGWRDGRIGERLAQLDALPAALDKTRTQVDDDVVGSNWAASSYG